MDYEELEHGIKYFVKKWPPDRESEYTYAKLRQRGEKAPDYWLHLEKMSSDDIAKEIINGFLNHWQCRIPTKTFEQWYASGNNLTNVVNTIHDYYIALASYRIEDVIFKNKISVNAENKPILDVINSIYSAFLQIKTKFGPIPASKLMHMALPDLFVMWDNGILQRYCIPKQRFNRIKAKSYTAFLILMQENINHVIKSYPLPGLTHQQIIQQIRNEHENLTLPRLLDMANMAIRDCEQAVCIECMKKAKGRWAKLGFVSTDEFTEDDSNDEN